VITKYIGSLVIAALVSVGFMTSPALAASPVGQLDLTITNGEIVLAYATLTCEPTGGTHPNAQKACDDLIPVKGQIGAIPPERDVFCIPEIQPVDVTATGIWAGVSVRYEGEFNSRCEAVVGTGGHVFDI
jgi:Subtilisin inhibitor-like